MTRDALASEALKQPSRGQQLHPASNLLQLPKGCSTTGHCEAWEPAPSHPPPPPTYGVADVCTLHLSQAPPPPPRTPLSHGQRHLDSPILGPSPPSRDGKHRPSSYGARSRGPGVWGRGWDARAKMAAAAGGPCVRCGVGRGGGWGGRAVPGGRRAGAGNGIRRQWRKRAQAGWTGHPPGRQLGPNRPLSRG